MKLTVQNCGEIPSFKNTKMIARSRLITDPRKQKIMEQIIQNLESQLRSLLETTATEMVTGRIAPSKIVLFLPLDDSLKWIGSHSVEWRKVSKGQEGFEIIIEPIK